MSGQAEFDLQNGSTDVVLHLMRRDGIPLTRKNYLDLAYPTGLPQPWTEELEQDLPEAIRHKR